MAAQTPAAERRTWAPLRRQPGPAWLTLLCGLAGHAAQATEADGERAALLAAVSHDLRAPLAAAKAAVSGLRSPDPRLSPGDRDELLATAEECLDQLTQLTAGLLDVSRLQAGAHAIFSGPADLGQIIADTLDGLGPRSQPVLTDIPSGLPQVIADPQITERVIVNLLSNAMRYSPPMSPPLLTARARGGRSAGSAIRTAVPAPGSGSRYPAASPR